MSPVDHEVVRRKLAALQNALAALEQSGPIDLDAYRRDFWRRKGTERVLQEMVEYEEIDDRIVLEAVSEARSLFPRFIVEIEGFLTRTP